MNSYFDLQVNGYGGVDFNQNDLSAEGLHHACERMERDGVGGFLATFVSEHLDVMELRLKRLAKLRAEDSLAQRLIAGVHIEGPFLSDKPGCRGAHPEDALRPATWNEMQRLLDAADGLTKLVTLAPERDAGLEVTKKLVDESIRVFAGHCDPTLDELNAACDAGLSGFTHLGNGCAMQMHRHDNIVQRALSLSDRLWLCFIGDGAHIAFFALKNYLRAAGLERCCVVTDAISPAGLGPGRYTVSRWTLDIGEDMVARAPDGSHLVGAAITMAQTEANLEKHLGLSSVERETLMRINPRRALGV